MCSPTPGSVEAIAAPTWARPRSARPAAFTWRLTTPMPEALFEAARTVAAA